jgi:hypothetical protein
VHTRRIPRALVVLATGVAGALPIAAPAGASEGQPAPPPPPPWDMTPPAVQPGPVAAPAPRAAARRRPLIRGARVVPHRVRSGRRATLRMSLSGAGRVRVTITRMSRPHRGRVAVLRRAAHSGRLTMRLPRAAHGRPLARGRYRVAIVVVDAHRGRSRTVRRSFVVR